MSLRLIRRLISADVLGFLLIVVALETLTYGISSSLRGTDTKYLFWICIISALITWLLGRAQWNGFGTSLVILAVGSIGVWILGARLSIPLINVARSVMDLIPQLIPAIREHLVIDTSPVGEAWSVVLQASNALGTRWHTWLIGLVKNINVNDALIRSMIWTFLMWLVAAWTGWFAARRNAVLALLPHMVLLALLISYSERKPETMWLIVFVLILLMGVWNYKNHTTQWERHKIDYSDSIRYDNTQAVVLLAITIGVLAFLTPSISWRDVRDYFRERNTNKAAEMLGVEEQKVVTKNIYVQKPSLPREHLLTEGFAQSQEIVMTIRTGELPPIPDPSLTQSVPRYYWRSSIYDGYTGAGWVTSSAVPQSYKENTPLIPGLLERYRPLHLDVKILQPEGRLFWSGILFSADVPIRADWRLRPVSDLFADQTTLLQADMFAAATGKTSYRAEAYVPVVTIEDLHNAPTDYPDEIRERYLLLPRELPQRVPQLAQQIVKGIENPYDKAKAIETYLRTNYPYDLDIPIPPEDQDVADYFLFDLKKGYCDYYATAMVVLARASGLPARFVSGYSSGSYDAPNAQYVVRELNAHSWPEIYFPEIGWVEFEPTGSQPEIERLEKDSEITAPAEPVTPASRLLFQFTHGKLLYWLSPIGIGILLVILYYALLEKLVFMSLTPVRAIEILYRRYYRMGRSLVGQRSHAETAHEFTSKLNSKLKELYQDARSKDQLVQLNKDTQQFTNLYTSTLFSNHSTGKHESKNAYVLWRHLRGKLLKERIRYYLFGSNKLFRSSY